jgi:hypothetical protein
VKVHLAASNVNPFHLIGGVWNLMEDVALVFNLRLPLLGRLLVMEEIDPPRSLRDSGKTVFV